MSLVAIWMDQKQAKLYQFTAEGIQKEKHETAFQHSTHGHDHRDEQKKEEQTFKQILPHLSTASEILILGPGITKTHFKKYLDSHSIDLSKKVVGIETTDHPSESQLLSFASKYFNTEHLKSN